MRRTASCTSSHPAVGRDVHLHAAGFQMTPRRQHRSHSSLRSPRCLPWRSSCRSSAIGRLPTRSWTEQVLYVSSRARSCSGRPCRTTRCSPTCTGSARCSTIGGERQKAAERAPLRSVVPAARSDDDARSAVHRRVPVRRHLSRRAAPGRRRAARPGDRTC